MGALPDIMPNMADNDETPSAKFLPTPYAVLRWVAAAGSDAAWFPSRHANDNNVPRDALDDPLALLRDAGLVRVRDWVKGLGQGYGITPDGTRYIDDPQKLAHFLTAPKREVVPDAVPTAFDRGEEARQALLEPKPAVAVPVLALANVFWFFVGLVLAINAGRSANAYLSGTDLVTLESVGAISGSHLLRGEWWRLFSCAFVHAGLVHIAPNMFMLVSIGGVAESVWGIRRFVALFFASIVGSSCLGVAVHPEALSAGASGANWGLMCSLIAWFLLNREHLPSWMAKRALQRLGIIFAILFALSFAPGVGWAAHFGGGIVGFLVGVLFVYTRRVRRAGRWIALSLVALIVVGCVVGLYVQSWRGSEWKKARLVEQFRQRVEFLKAVEPEMKPIQQGPVDSLYRQTMDVVHLGAKKPDLPARVEKLRDDAANIAALVERQPRPTGFNEVLQQKYRNYAAAVRDLAGAMLEQLQNPDADFAKLKERKRTVDELRAEFQRPEKFEF